MFIALFNIQNKLFIIYSKIYRQTSAFQFHTLKTNKHYQMSWYFLYCSNAEFQHKPFKFTRNRVHIQDIKHTHAKISQLQRTTLTVPLIAFHVFQLNQLFYRDTGQLSSATVRGRQRCCRSYRRLVCFFLGFSSTTLF